MAEPLSDARADELREAVREKYRVVAQQPAGAFPYPVGRESARELCYEAAWLDAVPGSVVDAFVGVGNPLRELPPRSGESVLDLGCGCGLDVFVAALLVGPEGRAVGVDLTPAMIEEALRASVDGSDAKVEFLVGDIEQLPFADATFDRVISNGALNLVPDKPAAFREACRVLKPGGTLTVADLLVMEAIPEEVLASMDAWST